MRIVENNARRLVLRDQSAWISCICWGAALVIALFAIREHVQKGLVPVALFGGFGLAFFRNSKVVLDKCGGACRLERREMWRVTRTIIDFDDVRDVRVQTMVGNAAATVTLCRLVLVTTRGDVPLSSTYEPGLARFEQMRGSVLASLSGKQSSIGCDPVKSLVEAGSRVDAIALLRRRDGLSLDQSVEKVGGVAADRDPDGR